MLVVYLSLIFLVYFPLLAKNLSRIQVMDLNQVYHPATPSPTPSPQIHGFLPFSNLPQCVQNMGESRCPRMLEVQRREMEEFWKYRTFEIYHTLDFKGSHQLPLARIKKIMKSDENVKMVSADTPVLFSKACEWFIMELTLRSWLFSEDDRRRTLQRCDIATAVRHADLFQFLSDIATFDDPRCQEAGFCQSTDHLPEAAAASVHIGSVDPAAVHSNMGINKE